MTTRGNLRVNAFAFLPMSPLSPMPHAIYQAGTGAFPIKMLFDVTGIQKQKPQPCHRANCSLAEGNHPGAIDADVATDVDDDDAVDAVDDTEADNVRGGAANHDAGTL